ncbi:MAG TPA: PAS domain S-box protein [Puia sp.]|nr:PAS domain S-box protein [Puia sp.]
MKTLSIPVSHWVNTLERQKPFYLSIIDAAGNLSFVNAPFLRKVNHHGEVMRRKNFLELVHPEDRDQLQLRLKDCDKTNAAFSAEIRILNGKTHWTKWEIKNLGAHGKNKNKFLCLGYDIAGEEQLKKYSHIAEHNYQAIVDGLNTGIIFRDAAGSVIAANPRAAAIFETTIENLYSQKDIYALLAIQDEQGNKLQDQDTPFMRALLTGETQNNVIIRFQKQKDIKWLMCNAQPLFENNESKPSSVVTSILDITREKNLEIKIREREFLFSAFMNNSPYFTWIVDEKENLVFANTALLEYFHGDESAFGKKMFQLIPHQIATIFHHRHASVLRKKIPDHSVIKSLMADGKERVFQISIFPVSDGAGTMLIGGKALDITDSYSSREKIKKVNERLLYLNKAASEAIWDWNLQTGKIFTNEALRKLIGFRIHKSHDLEWWFERIHPDDRAKMKKKIAELVEKKQQSWEDEFRFQCADGNFKIFHSRGFIVYEKEQPIRMIGSSLDVSETKYLESQLFEEKLKKQKQIAESIIIAQQDERTRIGHELHDNVNQILATAQLYLSMLKADDEDSFVTKTKTSEAIILAIEEIRKLSKELVMPNLHQLGLIAAINTLISDLNYAGLFSIGFDHPDTCDAESLSLHKKITLFRIVQEQTKNIVKYSRAKNVRLTLDCTEIYIRLSIADDGIGFDPNTTRRGIGLSNIYERAKLYNGEVNVVTAPGKGCKMEIKIPRDL